MAKGFSNPVVSKPLGGLLFVLFWAIAIVAWCFVPHLVGHGLRGFIADVGIVFASLGFASPFILTKSGLRIAMLLSLLGIALFAVADFTHIVVLVYFLRLLGPILALLAPVNKLSSTVKIWS
jgi:hypothetical protein